MVKMYRKGFSMVIGLLCFLFGAGLTIYMISSPVEYSDDASVGAFVSVLASWILSGLFVICPNSREWF
jgi:hypothetical protein